MIKVEKGHVNLITDEGQLIGIVYHDMSKRSKILYECVEMEEEEIVSLIQKN